MTLYDAHVYFKLELDKLDISSYPSFLPEEIDYFLNASISRFVKTRYSGLNVHRKGFQQNQKRSDDLRTFIKTIEYYDSDTVDSGSNFYVYPFPDDYWFMVGESSEIEVIVNEEEEYIKKVELQEATIENIDSKLSNTLSDHILNHGTAKPIRVYIDNLIYIYTDGTYNISKYNIIYIAKPEILDTYKYPEFDDTASYLKGDRVTVSGKQYECTANHQATSWPDALFKEVDIVSIPDHAFDEIITGAVRLALENISDSRYQTYSQESQVIE